MEKKANHQANIVRVTEILPHNNADSLEIIPLGEYQVVSRKEQFKVGDLAVYIQPDSVVPQTEPFRFIWETHIQDWAQAIPEVSDKHRRITVKKLRGEWSEGLLLPVTDFWIDGVIGLNGQLRKYLPIEGEDVSEELGITHYNPDADKEPEDKSAEPRAKRGYPRSIKGWYKFLLRRLFSSAHKDLIENGDSLGIPVYDVDSLKNYPHIFQYGEFVIATEKIHGSNARFIYLDGKQYAGSRNQWKAEGSKCIFRKVLQEQPWIGEFCQAHPGYVLWGELTPTQKGYEYGSSKPQLFVFDVRSPEGKWLDVGKPENARIMWELADHYVPMLYEGMFDLDQLKALADGPSQVNGAKSIREGIVIKAVPERHVRGLGRAQLKVVSNKFLEKDNK
jgi:hypothetical protein